MTARNVGKDVDKLDHSYLANGTVTLENSNKRSRELSYDPSDLLWGIIPENWKVCSHKNPYTNAYNLTWDSQKTKVHSNAL